MTRTRPSQSSQQVRGKPRLAVCFWSARATLQGDCQASYQPLAASTSSWRLMPPLVKGPLCRPCCKQPLPATLPKGPLCRPCCKQPLPATPPAPCWLLFKPPVQVQVQSHGTATAAPKTTQRPVQQRTWTATTKEENRPTHHQNRALAHGAPSSSSLSCCCLVMLTWVMLT